MPTTRIRTAIVAASASALCVGVLSGCSITRGDEPEPQGNSTVEPTDEPTEEPSDEPSAATSEDPTASASPSASASASSTPAATPEAALLTAAQLPQLNDTSPWTQGRTGAVGTRPFGLCQKFDLLSIGAMTAVERAFTSPGSRSDTAGQQVAEFPDAQNAVRAGKVIQAWHRDCASRVKGRNVKVRPITDVAVPTGSGWTYLVSRERQGQGQFHSLGVVVSGTRMTLLRIDHAGQDHNYEPGTEPMELAVKAAAARLG